MGAVAEWPLIMKINEIQKDTRFAHSLPPWPVQTFRKTMLYEMLKKIIKEPWVGPLASLGSRFESFILYLPTTKKKKAMCSCHWSCRLRTKFVRSSCIVFVLSPFGAYQVVLRWWLISTVLGQLKKSRGIRRLGNLESLWSTCYVFSP